MTVGERLRELDNRVLRLDKSEAKFATEVGWRRRAARWRVVALGSAAFLVAACVTAFTRSYGLCLYTAVCGGFFAFQAGGMKAEDDRLHRRGPVERLRPPGL